jgi:hypothetical protein
MNYGFRMIGGKTAPRRLVDAKSALMGYAACAPSAEVEREAYLSAFTFGDEFRRLLEETGSTRGYTGPCCSLYQRWDVDRKDLNEALTDAKKLADVIVSRYQAAEWLLTEFSGAKGFHLELPTAIWNPEPSDQFHRVSRRFAEAVAEEAGVEIDTSIYDRVRPFRAPNSRHPRTGLHKVRLALNELNSIEEIKTLAARPRPFSLPCPERHCDQAAADWQAATTWVQTQAQAAAVRTDCHLNRLTLDFINDGAKPGERATRLFSAAANLAEFGCPLDLAHALLTDAALDSGLAPAETRRQIECGFAHRNKNEEA